MNETDMQLAERATGEVRVRLFQQRGFFRAEPGVIQRPEHRIVTGRGSVLPGGGDPLLHEVEELGHPFGCRRRKQSRGLVADMPRSVELVDRADQPDAERGLDLGRLTGLQEPVEALEDLHVLPPGRGLAALDREVTDDAVDVLGRHVPRGSAERRERPLQQPDVVVDGHRAEPAGPPRSDERVNTRRLELPRIRRQRRLRDGPARDDLQSRLGHRHTFLAPERSRQHLENQAATARTNEDRRNGKRPGGSGNPCEGTNASPR
ncbi:hypothetical protein [Streptomyces deccanensis]|uniref:hypothetical protein n=1 Tax=Streptomyces deccanensis TaxID=424188 RepID=UPI001EFC0CF8|nr:hypothetical protein [Streptomyces deccanensis]ULR54403.1 hypothetical protein L3078_36815 [Streptomyces deccanensis]